MERAKRIMANATFAIVVLLTFLLFFEQRIQVPVWLQAFGRMHPLLLHLPIGLLLLATLLVFLRKQFAGNSLELLISFLLHITAITASVTALMGIFLSREGGYDALDLSLHKWFGVATCYVTAALLFIKTSAKMFKPSLVAGAILLIVAGHFGSVLTHGDAFVLGPFQQNEESDLAGENATAFEAVVQPIFERKCTGCHNETKAKGKLILTSYEHMIKGGKSGALWKENDPNSLLVKRIHLPLSDKKHMPPKDKPQLTPEELNFLSLWIAQGADTKKKLTDYTHSDSLRLTGSKLIASSQQNERHEAKYHFDFVSSEKIQALNNPYRAVFQIAQNEPALQADFFVRQAFEKENLAELSSVSKQVVAINLSKMPVKDEDLALLKDFENLEILNLNQTDITGSGLSNLRSLEHLESLSLSGTKVTINTIDAIKSIRNLKKVFIWNTGITSAEAEQLKKKYPEISWELGYQVDRTEMLKLSAPLLVSENVVQAGEKIRLKSSMPGTTIRYTTDGTEPDSITGTVYTDGIAATSYQIVKATAVKEGWRKSDVATFVIFQSGLKPSRAELKTLPDAQYQGEGVATFTNNKKGSPEFFRDPAWIAWRDRPLEAVFWFDDMPTMHSVTLSYAESTYAMTWAPARWEIWGGDDEAHLKLLQRGTPSHPTALGISNVRGIELTFPPVRYKCYKLIAEPLNKQPAFRKTKEKGWLMVDEIFFN
ncbi:MAG TPA: FN3 associated domain-containing protein [Cyclobacteriaceae bacterium]|nr:chitobiase/beta-hexosaminidase C-terminal domain-containing protein [Cyclobacteriaceae bacterium]HMV11138.1 FN3 associated domain-containing protein [Cyclobacteriaceae bacterium]HMV90883.1 FN3 associated domain-containing protein [Cyclobacteriaceae bacterium]HMX01751.1 FN3 associated domain-containing protein [Cyclobacteriaceae bacterium]HMY95575.1 FN3 associated domain-containing protein [Cyclobacteriaceae bacterium]